MLFASGDAENIGALQISLKVECEKHKEDSKVGVELVRGSYMALKVLEDTPKPF
ncbi:hypothetical protein [Pedobacter antarcticus]|uniref:hypothetical protein n=1 Tax=Pedobacter antarcticus TaxID=34086 RepID=UPI000A599C24|nr:hypothetical protein [Pedobacter antarcticus]